MTLPFTPTVLAEDQAGSSSYLAEVPMTRPRWWQSERQDVGEAVFQLRETLLRDVDAASEVYLDVSKAFFSAEYRTGSVCSG